MVQNASLAFVKLMIEGFAIDFLWVAELSHFGTVTQAAFGRIFNILSSATL